MKTMKKLLSIVLALTLVLSLGITAFAGDTPGDTPGGNTGDGGTTGDGGGTGDGGTTSTTPTSADENRYEGGVGDLTDIVGGTMTFDKYLVINANADVPDVKFKFTIEAIEPDDVWDAKGEKICIAPVDGTDIIADPDHDEKDSSEYNVIGKPVFVAVANVVETDETAYEDDTAILTYKKGDDTKPESEYRDTEENGYTLKDKTVAFMTDPTATGAKHWYPKDEKVAEKPLTVSFEGVTFLEPGVYRYIIREIKEDTDPQLPGMVYDPDVAETCVRYLDVYVVDEDGALVIKGYVLHESDALTIGTRDAVEDDDSTTDIDETQAGAIAGTMDVDNDGDKLDDKSTGFTNQYDTKSLAFKKEVAGNQGSRDKFFKYTVTVTPSDDDEAAFNASWFEIELKDDASSWVWEPSQNVATSDDYTLAIMKAANDPNTLATDTSRTLKIEDGRVFVLGSALSAGKVFFLQHGNYIMIRNLPASAEYEVAEVKEDYDSTEAGVENYKNAVSGTLTEEDENSEVTGQPLASPTVPDDVVYTSYLNTRQGVIPTGIITVIAPAVAVILLAVVGLGVVLLGKRRREETAE